MTGPPAVLQRLGLAAVLMLAAGASPAPPHALNLDAGRWLTYANGSEHEHFAPANVDGALVVELPVDAPPFFTAFGRSTTAPSDDYLFTDAPPLTGARALSASFALALSPGAALNTRFEASNTCPGGPTARLLFSAPGPLTDWRGATLPYTRWYSAPIALTPGAHTLTVLLDPSAWTDVFADRGDSTRPPRGQSATPLEGFRAALAHPRVGLVLGGGCFAGHGVGVVGGTGRLTLTGYEIE